MNVDLINDWKPETRSLIASLKKHGCEIVEASNGEDRFLRSKFKTEAEFLEELLACDEGALYVRTPNSSKLRWVYLVLGNSPGELVCDYTVDPAVEAASKEHYEKWETKGQPKLWRVCARLARIVNNIEERSFKVFVAKTEAAVRLKALTYANKNGWTITS